MTIDNAFVRGLVLYTAITSGLCAGIFYAFSSFVMRALGRLPADQGIAAMNSINKEAPTFWFMFVLMGTALTGVVLGVYGVFHLGRAGAVWLIVGAVAYLVAVVMTIVFHVPRNDQLLGMDPDSVAAADYWRSYLSEWTWGNHLRVLGPLVAAVAFTVAWRQSR
ncbi:DUF1772 domain-containing protein [Nocardia sp. alder85J]|uniref:anthrone oxygenase family protein n=1 Tax=Nocardia sp. alder85J TaxID=2862949 RepID=UPI001CD7FA61|nr:anthrone oxygenase family protein [Nocardia sp. alder85J]MCX4099020.1 DUF1772 domain-containing protein [Nocardia sp. alder85J]